MSTKVFFHFRKHNSHGKESAEESEIHKLRWVRRSLLFQMAGVLRSLSFWMTWIVYVMSLVLAQDKEQFIHYNSSKAEDLHLDVMATIDDDGRLHRTKFEILLLQGGGQDMAFALSPTRDLRYAGGEKSDLGLFNKKNDNKTES